MHKTLTLITLLLTALLVSSCGVGAYSTSSGLQDKARLCFITDESTSPINVTIDGQDYTVKAVKSKAYRKDKKIKKLSNNTIDISTGKHHVVVEMEDTVVLDKYVFVSAGEVRTIEL